MGRYELEWISYRRLRLAAILCWLGILPFAWSLQIFDSLPNAHQIRVSLLAAYGVFWMLSALRFEFFRCPRCGQFFSVTWWYNTSFLARKCVHCDLPKFSDEP
jgi:hypothetical protein